MHKNKFFLFPFRAFTLCLAFLTTAHSAVIYSGLRNASNPANLTPASGTDQRLPVDLNGEGGPEITLVNRTTSVYSPPYSAPSHLGVGDGMTHYPGGYSTVLLTQMLFIPSLDFVDGPSPGYTGGMSPVLAMLGVDTLIGPDSVFSLGDVTTVGRSNIGPLGSRASSGYFGFRFNPSGGQALYGWGHIISGNSWSLAAGRDIILTDWAYDDSGAPIRAGQIPEPSGAALAGLAGLAAASLRLRRGGSARRCK